MTEVGRKIRICEVAGVLAILIAADGCSLSGEDVQGGRPQLYRGPLSVIAMDRGGTIITTRTDGVRRRTTWTRPDGGGHEYIHDPVRGRASSWSDERRSAGVSVQSIGRRPLLRYWGSLGRTKRGEACHAAGESGYIWRNTNPPDWKNGFTRITEACISDDGVVLRQYIERQPGHHSTIDWEAVSVSRAPVDENVFLPPVW